MAFKPQQFQLQFTLASWLLFGFFPFFFCTIFSLVHFGSGKKDAPADTIANSHWNHVNYLTLTKDNTSARQSARNRIICTLIYMKKSQKLVHKWIRNIIVFDESIAFFFSIQFSFHSLLFMDGVLNRTQIHSHAREKEKKHLAKKSTLRIKYGYSWCTFIWVFTRFISQLSIRWFISNVSRFPLHERERGEKQKARKCNTLNNRLKMFSFCLVLYKSFIFFLFCRSGTVHLQMYVYAFSAHSTRHLQSTCQIFYTRSVRYVSNAIHM